MGERFMGCLAIDMCPGEPKLILTGLCPHCGKIVTQTTIDITTGAPGENELRAVAQNDAHRLTEHLNTCEKGT
jgi:hypothetical protein